MMAMKKEKKQRRAVAKHAGTDADRQLQTQMLTPTDAVNMH